MSATRRTPTFSVAGFGAAALTSAGCGIGGGRDNNLPLAQLGPATVHHLNVTPAAAPTMRWQQYLFETRQQKRPQITIDEMRVTQDELPTKLQTLLAAGTPPDTAALLPTMVLAVYRQKALTELDPFLKRDAKEVQLDDFFEGAIQRVTKGGKKIAMPFQMSVEVLADNKPLFDSGEFAPEPPYVVNQDAFQKALDAMLATIAAGATTAVQAAKEAKPQIEALL